MKLPKNPKENGFTLVELLVVIVIIGALAALSFTVGPRMLAKGKATEAMQNLRQLGPILTGYAADHDMKLPPAKAPAVLPDGTNLDLQWNEVCLAALFPETLTKDLQSKAWWDKNKTAFKNPLFKQSTPLIPGYALNQMIAENIAIASSGSAPSKESLLTVSVPIASISDPGRTPMIAPYNNYIFRYDEDELKGFKTAPLKDLATDGKVPVLFVDGHIESVGLTEYTDRKLAKMPVPAP